MKILIHGWFFCLALTLASPLAFAQDQVKLTRVKPHPKWTGQSGRLDDRFMGKVRLEGEIHNSQLSLRIEIHATGRDENLWNPMLHGRDAPCRIVLFDSDHRYVGDLPAFGNDTTPDHWSFHACDQDNTGYGRNVKLALERGNGRFARSVIPAGDYYLHAIIPQRLLGRFVNDPKQETLEFMRSNVLDIHFAEPVSRMTLAEPAAIPNGGCPVLAEIEAPKTINVPNRVACTLRLTNISPKMMYVYDPHLFVTKMGQTAPAGALVVLDSEGKVLGDLLQHGWAKANGPSVGDWKPMPPGGIIRSRINFNAGVLYNSGDVFSGTVSKSDTWKLQFRIFDRMLSEPPPESLLPQDAFAEPLDQNFREKWFRNYRGKVISTSSTRDVRLTR